ncbi:hypothetical protein MMC25_007296 [Agyrium rufum]|nr:hypothetical protein [Agyrium rufum]
MDSCRKSLPRDFGDEASPPTTLAAELIDVALGKLQQSVQDLQNAMVRLLFPIQADQRQLSESLHAIRFSLQGTRDNVKSHLERIQALVTSSSTTDRTKLSKLTEPVKLLGQRDRRDDENLVAAIQKSFGQVDESVREETTVGQLLEDVDRNKPTRIRDTIRTFTSLGLILTVIHNVESILTHCDRLEARLSEHQLRTSTSSTRKFNVLAQMLQTLNQGEEADADDRHDDLTGADRTIPTLQEQNYHAQYIGSKRFPSKNSVAVIYRSREQFQNNIRIPLADNDDHRRLDPDEGRSRKRGHDEDSSNERMVEQRRVAATTRCPQAYQQSSMAHSLSEPERSFRLDEQPEDDPLPSLERGSTSEEGSLYGNVRQGQHSGRGTTRPRGRPRVY